MNIGYVRKLGDEIADIESASKRLTTTIAETERMLKRLTHAAGSRNVEDALEAMQAARFDLAKALSAIEDDMPAMRLETPAR